MRTMTPATLLALLVVVGLCLAVGAAGSGAGGLDSIPAWHPHAARRRQERKAREAAAAADKPVWSDLGCGTVENSKWERRLCFGDVLAGEPGADGLVEVGINLTVHARDKGGPQLGGGDGWAPSCGDALRIRFLSTRSIFAPGSHTEPACGVHELRFVLPPDAPEYEAEVFVAHINGEGSAEPKVPRLFPLNLVNFKDGPDIYNLRVENWPKGGRLHVPLSYLSDTTDMLDAYALRSAGYPVPGGHAPGGGAAEVSALQAQQGARRSPVCLDGTAAGRWVFHQSLTPAVPGEPLEWRPYRCHYSWYTGEALTRCVERQGRIKMVGESTLGQLYELLLTHMNNSGFYWPAHIGTFSARADWGRPELMRAQGVHSEFHGLSVVNATAEAELREWPPEVIVQLQVANDAARDTFAMYDLRLREWIARLKALIGQGVIKPRRHIWITAPVRQYKAGNGPGTALCPEGTVESCRSVFHGTSFEDNLGEVNWLSSHAEPPMFWGTLDRRRKFNAHSVKVMREAFPELEVIDFEAMTEGLPADYCIDGEHWGCPKSSWDNRHREAYQCKALGNIVLGQVFANVLCNSDGPLAAQTGGAANGR